MYDAPFFAGLPWLIAAVYWDYFSEGEDTDVNVDFTNMFFLLVSTHSTIVTPVPILP